MAPDLTLRPATEADLPFLEAAYASSRVGAPDLAIRHPDSAAALVHAEFESRQQSYLVNFPGVEYSVVEHRGVPVGRLYVQRTPTRVFVVDLVLLPSARGHGFGTHLLRTLLAEAAAGGKCLQLHVEKTNASASRLYRRLGLRVIDDIGTHHLMECRPA